MIAACAIALAASGAAARADIASSASGSGGEPYVLKLRALTGPQGADLRLEVDAAAGFPAVTVLKKVQVKTYDGDGKVADVVNLVDVRAPGGVADVELGASRATAGSRPTSWSSPTAESPTNVPVGATRTRLRPDLVVAAVHRRRRRRPRARSTSWPRSTRSTATPAPPPR